MGKPVTIGVLMDRVFGGNAHRVLDVQERKGRAVRAGIVYEEYECGSYCSPDGCHGHEGRVIGIEIDGFVFCDEESHTGDMPQKYEELAAAVERAVEVLNMDEKTKQVDYTAAKCAKCGSHWLHCECEDPVLTGVREVDEGEKSDDEG